MSKRKPFQEKVVIVTGAAQGIGRGVAMQVAAEGGKVLAVDRSDLVKTSSPRSRKPGQGISRCRPTSKPSPAPRSSSMDARSKFKRIDVLINNVGGTIWAKPFEFYEEAQIEAEIRRSLFPTLWCCRAVLPTMIAGPEEAA